MGDQPKPEDLVKAIAELRGKVSRQDHSTRALPVTLNAPLQLVTTGAKMLWLALERLVSNAHHAISELGLTVKPTVTIRQDQDGSTAIEVENPALIKNPAAKLAKLCKPAAESITPWRNEYGGISLPTIVAIARRLGAQLIAKYTSPEGQVTEHQFC